MESEGSVCKCRARTHNKSYWMLLAFDVRASTWHLATSHCSDMLISGQLLHRIPSQELRKQKSKLAAFSFLFPLLLEEQVFVAIVPGMFL